MTCKRPSLSLLGHFRRSKRKNLNDLVVSISPLEMVLESEDKAQKAGKVSGAEDMKKRGILDQKISLTEVGVAIARHK